MSTWASSSSARCRRRRGSRPRRPKATLSTHAQMRKQGEVLEHQPDPAHLGRHRVARLGHQLAAEADAAALDRLEAGDQAQDRGLAAARGPHQAMHLALGQIEADAVHHDALAVGMAQPVDLQAAGDAGSASACAMGGRRPSWSLGLVLGRLQVRPRRPEVKAARGGLSPGGSLLGRSIAGSSGASAAAALGGRRRAQPDRAGRPGPARRCAADRRASVRSRWSRKAGVVTHVTGRPGLSRLPFGCTQPVSSNRSSVPLLTLTPRISSISARVTGWW